MSLRTLFLILFCITGLSGLKAQEFKVHDNGLVYNDTTMAQLRFIVDSMNLKYKRCDLSKTYYAVSQATGYYVRLDTGKNIDEAYRNMLNGMRYEDFVYRYPLTETEELLVLKTIETNYKNIERLEFTGIKTGYGQPTISEDDTGKYQLNYKGKWIPRYYKRTSYSKSYIEAFYMPEDFSAPPLTYEYAKQIQYADCMIDTNSQVFYDEAEESESFFYMESDKKVGMPKRKAFLDYIDRETNAPKRRSHFTESYWKEFDAWNKRKDSIVVNLAKTTEFRQLLDAAVKEGIEKKNSLPEFEEYVEKYYSKETALYLKRCRIVVGSCSRDMAPRDHALDIAKLSAESINWDIFLRSHLDIMNDNFQRASDGSYAYGSRGTYIKELEALDIDIPTLLLGISLRINNPAKGHYYGSISRVGRAISESKDRRVFEIMMSSMIKDNQLDDYNRFLIYYLFRNYISYIGDKTAKAASEAVLKEAFASLPQYMKRQVSDSEKGE